MKSIARESPEKTRTDELQKPGRRPGQNTQPRSRNKRLKKADKGEGDQQPHKPEKKQNVLREVTKMRTKTMSPQKNQAARIQHMSQPEESSGEPTRKATSKMYFHVFSLAGQTNTTFLFFLL